MSQKDGDYDDIDNTTKFLYPFTQNILNIHRSIRWVGILIKMVLL